MGWERLVELITEPALLMRRNGVLANAAWTALIGAKPQSAVALGLLLKNAALATLVEQSLETGKELTASVSLPAKLLSSHTCDLKIVPLDRESYCCVLPGGWKDSYEQVLASHGTTMGCVFELDGGNAASQVWTSNVHLPRTFCLCDHS